MVDLTVEEQALRDGLARKTREASERRMARKMLIEATRDPDEVTQELVDLLRAGIFGAGSGVMMSLLQIALEVYESGLQDGARAERARLEAEGVVLDRTDEDEYE